MRADGWTTTLMDPTHPHSTQPSTKQRTVAMKKIVMGFGQLSFTHSHTPFVQSISQIYSLKLVTSIVLKPHVLFNIQSVIEHWKLLCVPDGAIFSFRYCQ